MKREPKASTKLAHDTTKGERHIYDGKAYEVTESTSGIGIEVEVLAAIGDECKNARKKPGKATRKDEARIRAAILAEKP